MHPLWQGEERDSSDEEWDSAYAAMDPIAQLGLGNRRVPARGGEELVRDVFAAADALHDEAMSEMAGNTQDNDAISGNGHAAAVDVSPMSPEGSVAAGGSGDADMEGVSGV